MKKTILSLAILASLMSCEVSNSDSISPNSTDFASGKPEDNPAKVNDDNGKKNASTTPVAMTMVIGGTDWKVNAYVDNKNRNRTSRYSSFAFGFVADGSVNINSGGKTIAKGTWKAVLDGTVEKLYLTITTTDNNLLELNEDWKIVSKSSTLLKLENVSGGNGGTTSLILGR